MSSLRGARRLATWRLSFAILAMLLGSCFWKSPSPDLGDSDGATELIVIWNHPAPGATLERASWSTTDPDALARLTGHLEPGSWTSSSVLPGGHDTRIILVMRSGRVWEIVLRTGERRAFGMFDREDLGWAGSLGWSEAFIAELTTLLEASVGEPVDLLAERRSEIRLGTRTLRVPSSTQSRLERFPGYPEMVWNESAETFEYAE